MTDDLGTPPGWTRDGAAIARTYRFGDFAAAWGFMSRVALLAERHDHHPDWRNSWGRVDIRLTTHDAGRVTEQDLALARAIDALVDGAPDAGSTP